MTIDVNIHTFETEMEKLHAIASGDNGVSQGIVELTIRGLSPTFDPSNQLGSLVRGTAVKPRQADEILKGCLLDALTSLKRVRKIRQEGFLLSVMIYPDITCNPAGYLIRPTRSGRGPSSYPL